MLKLVLAGVISLSAAIAPAFGEPQDTKPEPRPMIQCIGDPGWDPAGCCSGRVPDWSECDL